MVLTNLMPEVFVRDKPTIFPMSRRAATRERRIPVEHLQRGAVLRRSPSLVGKFGANDSASDARHDPARLRRKMYGASIVAVPASIALWALIIGVVRAISGI